MVCKIIIPKRQAESQGFGGGRKQRRGLALRPRGLLTLQGFAALTYDTVKAGFRE